jgi:protein TonB
MVGVAVHLTSGLTLTPAPEPLRIEIAMTEAPVVQEPERPAPAAPKPAEAETAPQSTEVVQPIVPPVQEPPKVEPKPEPEKVQPAMREPEPAPMVAAVPAQDAPVTATVVPVASEPALVKSEPAGSTVQAADVPAAPAAPVPAVVASLPRGTEGGGKADYGWLADSIWRRISAIQRYPFQARLNHWEGRVIVRAVIRHDGHLEHLAVHETSGHPVLDEEALELIRRVCPLHMKRALGRQQVAVLVPVNYRLND